MFQPRRPLPRILHLSDPRVSVLPEDEEFFVMLYGCVALVFVYLAEHLEALGIDLAIEGARLMKYGEIRHFKFGITEVIILTS